ncbi:hypothetical protein ABT337_00040 [Saccharopolyspora hirsuta]|uniref:Uncharacterized protein n=1 Tax=Saccharopolyspora hirsuta TaxID=1837 RepID=A0A5M7BSL1_SACHI|nr:hypothetical protein [Saccharopolyspora hirsuta]KAA5831148.1 hypothetical protein F1721_20530 [Saccharopolyspora hirsuta]
MLLVVLLLVLLAAGVLIAAVVVGDAELAWLSVLASAVAVGLLAADRVRRRRAAAKRAAAEPPFADVGEEPAEERSNAAEAARPDAQVLVIDERPRYHVRTCEWIGSRKTIELTLREARELGFTPCALCAPNATIAAEVRRS